MSFDPNAARWLDSEQTARYISVRAERLARLVKAGKLPKPNYELGIRSPRWDRFALDAVFEGCRSAPVINIDQGSAISVAKILDEGRSRRQKTAR